MEWISVKDRLPDNGTVLVTDGKIVVTAPSSSVTVDGAAISHWMPLPEPPEEKYKEIFKLNGGISDESIQGNRQGLEM